MDTLTPEMRALKTRLKATWTAEGFIGQLFKTIGKHVPPLPLMPSPLLWGNEATVRERLSDGVAHLQLTKRQYLFDYPFGPAKVVARRA
jgi:hypothetical protein